MIFDDGLWIMGYGCGIMDVGLCGIMDVGLWIMSFVLWLKLMISAFLELNLLWDT
jgi:hypothetical protein